MSAASAAEPGEFWNASLQDGRSNGVAAPQRPPITAGTGHGTSYAVGPNAWKAQGKCRGSKANFFPDVNAAGNGARATCAGCPVAETCLVSALRLEDFGVWGGMGHRARKAYIRAELRPSVVQVEGGFAAQAICWPAGRARPLALRSQTFPTRAAAQGAFAPVLRTARRRHDWRAALQRKEAA